MSDTIVADDLIEKLREKQNSLHLSDRAFAAKMGISRQTWGKVQSGHRNPGEKFWKAVMRTFPEFTIDVMSHINRAEPTGASK